MASLTGQLVAETYKALLKVIDNDVLTASEKQITDGFGGGSNVFIDSNGFLRANKYKITNGLATQFLKADGSLDANTYLTSITSAQVTTALGYTPVTDQRTLTINGVTYNLTANRSWTVEGTAAVWGNITGTLSNQTDLQAALNAKYNVPAGTISQYIRGDGTLATFPTLPGGLPTGGAAGQILAKIDATDYNTQWIDNYATQTKNEVKLGATLAKGAAVYVSSANGTNMIVSAASNTAESLSSKTFGLLETGGVTNDLVKCVTFGLLAGLDTSAAQAGDPVWLGVNGALLFGVANKPVAPANMVYIGVVTRVQQNNGEIFVNIQNGFEIEELHDVLIQSKANNQGLFYEASTGLWKNKSIATVLGYTPQAQLDGTGFVKASGTTITYDNSTYLTTTDAESTYQRLDNIASSLFASATNYPNNNAVIAGLALKADAANPVFTGSMNIVGLESRINFYDENNLRKYFIGYDSGTLRIFQDTGSASRFYITPTGQTFIPGTLTVGSVVKDGGTASQFLKADGSIDSNTYVQSSALADYLLISTAASTYQRLDRMSINLLASDINYPNNNAVINALALKADAANPVFTGNMTISGAEPKLFFTDTDNNPDYTVFIDSGIFYIYDQTNGATRFSIGTTGNISAGVGKSITADSFIKDGGTATQFLKADGSIDSNTYVASSALANYLLISTAASTYQRLDNMAINLLASDTQYPNNNAVIAALALKANAANPVFTGNMSISGAEPKLFFVDTDNNPDYTVFIDSGFFYIYDQTAGATRFQINSSGNISTGVGKSITAGSFIKEGGTSSQILLADGSVATLLTNQVTGTGTTNYIPKWTGSNALGNSIIFNNATSVGIGLTNPQSQLQINGDLTFSELGFDTVRLHQISHGHSDGSSVNNNLRFLVSDGSGTTAERMRLNGLGNLLIGTVADAGYKLDVNGQIRSYSSSSSIIAQSSVAANDAVVSARWSSVSGIEMRYNPDYALTNFDSLYTATSGQIFGDVRFRINAGGVMTPVMTIKANNTSVGIGTTSPTDKLHVYSSATTGEMRLGGGNGAGNARMYFQAHATTAYIDMYGNNSYLPLQINASPLSFMGGNVLVGTTTDSGFKFDVNGTGRFSGDLRIEKATPLFVLQASAVDTLHGIEFRQGAGFDAFIKQLPQTGEFRISNGRFSGWGGYMTFYTDTNLRLTIASNGDSTFTGKVISNDQFRVLASGNYRINNNVNGLLGYFIRSGAWKGNAENNLALATDGPYGISFFTNGTGVERFHISSAGNVMMNTTTSSTTGGFTNTTLLVKQVADGGAGGGLQIEASGSDNVAFFGFNGSAFQIGTSYRSTGSYQPIDFLTNGPVRMRLSTAGNLLVGTTTDSGYKLAVLGTTRVYQLIAGQAGIGAGNYTIFSNDDNVGYIDTVRAVNSGDFQFRFTGTTRVTISTTGNVTATAFFESSDLRLKTLIKSNPIIDRIEKLEAKLYEKNGKIEIGYFAQDAELIMPYAVTKNSDGFLNLSYREVHTAKIARLEQRVAELEKQLNLN